MIGVDRSRENLSGIGLALKKEIIIKDLLIPPQEEVIQLILRHDFLVGKDFTIECAVLRYGKGNLCVLTLVLPPGPNV